MGEYAADDDGLALQLVGLPGCLFLADGHLHSGFTQAFDKLEILFAVEITQDALCNLFTDFVHVNQVVQRSRFQVVDGAERTCHFLGHGFAHKADAQCKDDTLVGNGLRFLYSLYDVLGRFFSHAVQPADVCCLQRVEVGHVVNQSLLIELVDGFRSQPFDVHGTAADEMLDAALYLCGATVFVRAVMCGFVLVAYQSAAAFRTVCDESHLLASFRTCVLVHSRNLRNDFAALFHVHHIAQMQVERLDDVGIVERSTFHHRTRKLNRFQIGHGSYRSRTSHLIRHLQQFGASLFRLKFISDGPARRLGRETQVALLAL